MTRPQLSPEDQQRVDKYLNTGFNTTERKPFRGWLLLGGIWLMLVGLGLVSYLIARIQGVI